MERGQHHYGVFAFKQCNITEDFAALAASGEANGLPIVFREDGYINMTKAAKHFNKKLSNFWDSPQTGEYLEAMRQFPEFQAIEIAPAKKGRYGGTFCHPKLAVFFARWLDVRFAVWCDLMIDNILRGNIQTTVAVPTQEAVEVQAVAEKLKARVLELEEQHSTHQIDKQSPRHALSTSAH